MKPVQLSQLISSSKMLSISFIFQSCDQDSLEDYLFSKVKTQEELDLISQFHEQIHEVLSKHPEQSVAFYLSQNFSGFYILNDYFQSIYFVDKKFHVRPIVESLLMNPEFFLINVSLYDIKVYRGERDSLDLTHHFEYDELTQESIRFKARFFTPEFMGVIPFKTMMTIKELSHRIAENLKYFQFPVIVTGLDEMKNIFLQYFRYSGPLIDNLHEDFYEKTSIEIHQTLTEVRHLLVDKYSMQLKEKIKLFQRSQKLSTEKNEISELIKADGIQQIIIPTLKRKSHETENELKEINQILFDVLKTDGKIEILSHHFFPKEITLMGVRKGHRGNLSLLRLSS